MGKIIYLAILIVAVIALFRKIMNTSGPHFQLKTILFVMGIKEIPKTTQLGRYIFSSKSKRKLLLPWDPDLWTQVDLFENGIVLRRHEKEKTLFFYEIYAIEPLLISSLFVKGKYFGYMFECRDNTNITLKSHNLCDLDKLINEICALFPDEKGEAVVMNI